MKWKGRCALDIAINNRLLKALPLGSALVQNDNNPQSDCNLFSKGNLFDFFCKICNSVSVPIADDKTEGPTTSMKYLGLLIDTEKMMVKIPTEKLNKLLEEIKKVAFAKKVTLKQLQSLCGLLSFCTSALPSGRAFNRRLFMAMSIFRYQLINPNISCL
jgi:hypothetical protein